MNKPIAVFCIALCAGVGAEAQAQAADNGGAFCTQLSSEIAAQSALFLKVAGTAPDLTDTMPSAPAVLQRVHGKDVALHNIANEIWSLRTRMARLDCTQARTFAY